jgi:TrmH family RNA methyltransferase
VGENADIDEAFADATKTEAITAPAAVQLEYCRQFSDIRQNRLESAKRKTVRRMPIRIVQSKQNARLKELRRALANPGLGPRGSVMVAIEGPIMIAEALRTGLKIDCVFAAQEAGKLLAGLSVPPDVDTLLMPRSLLSAVLTTDNPQPLAALVQPPHWTWKQAVTPALNEPQLLLVLAGIQDPGNLGAILRSAEAFGATGIVSLPGTVSEWNPKTLRAAAGSVFRLPIVHGVISMFTVLKEMGIRILTTSAQQGEAADGVDLTGRVALLIGNEGNGVPPNVAEKADGAITIPCPGPVESLNAAVAASVLLYEAARQRAVKDGGPQSRNGGTR